jgi:hypothetical protein
MGIDPVAQMVQGKTLMKQILYISYDGMTDPLGQSQIIPYLQGLSKYGYRFTILSFEKKERFEKEEALVRELLEEASIKWVPLMFTRRPPILSKFYDAVKMRKTAYRLQRENHYDMVHCRSYIAADVGLRMKKKFSTKFFFDMRGFWADEKKDGGSWNQSNLIFRSVYKYYKKKEKQFLQNADYIISLTEAGRKEMLTWEAYNPKVPIQVIPCCADMNHFSLTDPTQKATARQLLHLPNGVTILSYLGSVGAWYMLDEMLALFSDIKKKYPGALFLFITHSPKQMILDKLAAHQLVASDVMIIEATRKQVPQYVKASDINISFIKPVYSKLSSSPTKLGEVLSMGIPVISNSGVGDVADILNRADAGIVIHSFDEPEYERAILDIDRLLKKDPATIRNKIENTYSLEKGIALYRQAYQSVFEK